MKGIILLATIFVILLIIGPLIPSPPRAVINYTITGCAETTDGMSTRDINEVRESSGPKVFSNGNEITYYRSLDHLCCRKVVIDHSFENEVLNIYEIWSGPGCRCICSSEINASITVPEGTYVINVYETGTNPEDGNKMTPRLLLTGLVEANNSAS